MMADVYGMNREQVLQLNPVQLSAYLYRMETVLQARQSQ